MPSLRNAYFEQMQIDGMEQWFRNRVLNYFAREFPGYPEKMSRGMNSREADRLYMFISDSDHNRFVAGLHMMRFCPLDSDHYRIGRQYVQAEIDKAYMHESHIAPALTDYIIEFLISREKAARDVTKFADSWELVETISAYLKRGPSRPNGGNPPMLTHTPRREI